MAHKRGIRVVLAGFGGLNESRLDAAPADVAYVKEWVAHGLKSHRATPWVDGFQLDWEHFPRHDFHPAALTGAVCAIQAGLKQQGQRLHSQDTAVWGSYGFFNVTELVKCLDFVVPMGYCNPASSTIAGPTDPLSLMEIEIKGKSKLGGGFLSAGVPPEKIVLGLPFFGCEYNTCTCNAASGLPASRSASNTALLSTDNFACANAAPSPYPAKGGVPPPCNLAQPPQYPMIGYFDAMTLFRTANVTSSPDHPDAPELRFHEKFASAWFEYTNKTDGTRHQVWFNDEQAIAKKSGYAFGAGMHGVSFWTADVLYGKDGADSPDARAMWRAAAPPQR